MSTETFVSCRRQRLKVGAAGHIKVPLNEIKTTNSHPLANSACITQLAQAFRTCAEVGIRVHNRSDFQ